MRKNFDMDAAIRRALRESIEAHAHEWEPNPDAKSSEIGDGSPFEKKVSGNMDEGTIPADAHEWEPDFKTGVGPVGDDAPFDNKVSESCNKEEACCPKCGKCPCECEKEGEMNEGTIPGDSHEWEPDFKTGVGPVGDDNPFTQAVNEAFVEGGDWEKGSFDAPEHKKEGIAFADGGDECQNGVVATGQKNSGEVVSSDNLSEGEDEEGEDERTVVGQLLRNGVQKVRDAWGNARTQARNYNAEQAAKKAGGTFTPSAGNAENGGASGQATPQGTSGQGASAGQANPSEKIIAGLLKAMAANGQGDKALEVLDKFKMRYEYGKYLKQPKQAATQQPADAAQAKAPAQPGAAATNTVSVNPTTPPSEEAIKEERDRFFNIINRIEKLYD